MSLERSDLSDTFHSVAGVVLQRFVFNPRIVHLNCIWRWILKQNLTNYSKLIVIESKLEKKVGQKMHNRSRLTLEFLKVLTTFSSSARFLRHFNLSILIASSSCKQKTCFNVLFLTDSMFFSPATINFFSSLFIYLQ